MKTALVTGANKGIGHEVARQLGSKGFHAFLGARNLENGQQATQALRKTGAMTTFVSDPQSIRHAAHVVSAVTAHLDVLVNNAGVILEGDNSITQLDPATITKTIQTNTLGPRLSRRRFCPCFPKVTARES